MRRFLAITISALLATLMVASVASAAPKSSTLKCFTDGTFATCTISGDTASLSVQTNGYAGVYINSKPNSSKGLASRVFAFTANGDVAGGAPRFSIPLNTSGGSSVTGYAFLDVAGCGGTANNPATVSTADTSCHVNYLSTDYPNWAALAAAFPAGKVAPGAIPFIISDQPGNYLVYNIVLR